MQLEFTCLDAWPLHWQALHAFAELESPAAQGLSFISGGQESQYCPVVSGKVWNQFQIVTLDTIITNCVSIGKLHDRSWLLTACCCMTIAKAAPCHKQAAHLSNGSNYIHQANIEFFWPQLKEYSRMESIEAEVRLHEWGHLNYL